MFIAGRSKQRSHSVRSAMFIARRKQTTLALREECHVYSPQKQATLALLTECHVYSRQKQTTSRSINMALLTECVNLGA
jgi:hypothetical protein